MDSQLQTLALIAAAVNKSLRTSLREDDFDPRVRSLVTAFKDGRLKESRERVRTWLADYGVTWDGKSDIGAAIIEALRIKASKERLSATIQKLRLRMAMGSLSEEQTKQAVEFLEGLANEHGPVDRQSDARPAGEIHTSGNGGG